MKMLVIAVLLIAGYLGYQTIMGSVRAGYDLCLEVAMDSTDVTSQLSCGAKRKVYEELARCVVVVQKETNLKAYLYAPLNYKTKVDTLIETHNEECPESTVELPREGIYL